MANTPRNESAFIVVGVAETKGRPTQIVGTDEHIDPSEVDRRLQDRVNAVPSVEYHVAEHEGHEIGIYEIKVDRGGHSYLQRSSNASTLERFIFGETPRMC